MQLLSTFGSQVDVFNLICSYPTTRDWLVSARLSNNQGGFHKDDQSEL